VPIFSFHLMDKIMSHLKTTDISTEEITDFMKLPIAEVHSFLCRHRLVVKWTDTRGEAFTDGPQLVNTLIGITDSLSESVNLSIHLENYLRSRSDTDGQLPSHTDDETPW
jgi:hypothetical protein